MIRAYEGEFLFTPCALDVVMNQCTYNCAYCFASIKTHHRLFNNRQAFNLILGRDSGKTIESQLFRLGYPICMSNLVDPFCPVNYETSCQMLSVLRDKPNGICFQTKGKRDGDYSRVWELVDGKKNIAFYITMTTLDESMQKRIEPGAPSPEMRIKLAKEAREHGYEVIIATNPLVEEWMPEPMLIELERRMHEIDVDNYFMQQLHINREGAKMLPQDRRERIGFSNLSMAQGANVGYTTREYFRMLGDETITVFASAPMQDVAYSRICDSLGKRMPRVYDFLDDCVELGEGTYTFSDFRTAIYARNPDLFDEVTASFKGCVMAQSRDAFKLSMAARRVETFEDYLRVFWNLPNFMMSPRRWDCFQIVTDKNKLPVRDEYGNIQLYFDGEMHVADRCKSA